MTANPSTRAPSRLGYAPFVRFALAWLITMGLVYVWGRVLIFGRLNGRPELLFVAVLLVGLLAVIVLTYDLSSRLPGRSSGGVLLAVAIPWILVVGILIGLFAGPGLPRWLVIALFIPATLWVPWVGWMCSRPLAWRTRLGVLMVLLAVMSSFWLLKVKGMGGGADQLSFVWRWQERGRGKEAIQAKADLTQTTPNDYPQFLGPNRDGVVRQAPLAADWKNAPPREKWRWPIGEGWSAFAIVGDYAVTQEQRGGQECVSCYRISDGEHLWRHEDPVRFEGGLGGPGPRATPTIHEGKVYTVGATGILNCLDGADGRRLWSVDILKDNNAGNLAHGVCGSPLIVDHRVLVCPTGSNGISLAAYDRETGERLWQGTSDQASYGSPLLATLHGVPQVLLYTGEGVAAHDPATGELLWKFSWTNAERVNCSQPIVVDGDAGRVFVATGYNKGSVLLQVEKAEDGSWSARPIWQSRQMKAKFATPVLYQDHVYGLDDGILACQDLATGQLKWKTGRYGHGQVLLAGDLLLVQTEEGPVVLVKPDPERLRELGSIPALSSKTWNNPALSGRFLLIRNDQEAACYELPLDARRSSANEQSRQDQ